LDAKYVDWKPKRKVEALQPNVRSVLVEMELLRAVELVSTKGGAGLKLVGSGVPLVSMGRLAPSVFDHQLKLVQSFAALRAERTSEILTQVVPQTAHWSSIAALSPDRHRYTWELVGVGLRFAMMMVMQLKYEFNVQRPWERSAVIQPMIMTPGYTAYPCGHATEASFVAELVPLLAADPTHPCAVDSDARKDGMARQLNRLAFRIAENRVVAGLHYPVDSIAGQALGVMLARYFVWLTRDSLPGIKKKDLTIGAVAFPEPLKIKGDEEQPAFDCFVEEQLCVDPPGKQLPKQVPDAPVLRDLWTLARREWSKE
jgi:hypothetical protein